jgi:hypothetical protein
MLRCAALVLVLSAGAAHAQQGNLPKPVQKLPAYPPVVCVTPNWTSEPCANRTPSEEADPRWKFFESSSWVELLKFLESSPAWTRGTEPALPPASFDKPVTDRMIYNGSGYLGDPPGIHSYPTMTPPTVMVLHNNGGNLSEFVAYWRTVAVAPDVVKVFGPCGSACTIVIAYIPKDRLCFGKHSSLNFHQARLKTQDRWMSSPETSKWMIDKYPANIRHWVMARGGPEKMLSDSYWTLPAEELWKMGYSKCNTEYFRERLWPRNRIWLTTPWKRHPWTPTGEYCEEECWSQRIDRSVAPVLEYLKLLDESWMGTAIRAVEEPVKPWNGKWPS